MRRRRRSGALAGGALAIALGAGLAVPAFSARTAASPEHATLAAWTVDHRPDESIVVTIRELKNLPALQRTLNAAGARVTVKAQKAFTDGWPNACSVREWSAFSGVEFEGAGKYFFILHPAKTLPGTLLKITVIPAIKQPHGTPSPVPLTPAPNARKVQPHFFPAPAGIGYAHPGETPSATFTPVRDVPPCVSCRAPRTRTTNGP